MELKEVQISEIKNLNLIYVFTTDSIFKQESNKYVGAKVVYDKTKSFSIDYSDKYFQQFIKRVLERYHKEKDKRKIILLGELTKKLVADSSFAVLEKAQKEGVQTVGLPSFNNIGRDIKEQVPYLKEAMRMILMVYKNYEILTVNDINGFNKKYMVNYSIGSVDKQLPIILSIRDDGIIDFKLSRVDDVTAPISGTLTSDGGRVEITWESNDEELQGNILFDAQNGVVERKVTSNGQTIIYDENKDTLLEEDVSIIKFYFDLCGLEVPSHILKVNDTTFLLSDEKNLENEEDAILYFNSGAQISLAEDEVIIKYRIKNCLSKYNNQINTVLDRESEEITFRRLDLETGYSVLVEEKTQTDDSDHVFNHKVFDVESKVDLRRPFEYVSVHTVDEELNTMEKTKQYIKQLKGGNQ